MTMILSKKNVSKSCGLWAGAGLHHPAPQQQHKRSTMEGIEGQPAGIPVGGDEAQNALRFEDLTIDDDLPLLDRVVRYCRSGIALQRLVHVKMLAETAETVG